MPDAKFVPKQQVDAVRNRYLLSRVGVSDPDPDACEAVREAALAFADVVLKHTRHTDDQIKAIDAVRKAVFWASEAARTDGPGGSAGPVDRAGRESITIR